MLNGDIAGDIDSEKLEHFFNWKMLNDKPILISSCILLISLI